MKTFSPNPPPEILTQIFEWLYMIAMGEPGPDLVDGSHVRQLCWPVSQVCKYWREVALAAPFLWTHLPTIILDQSHVSSSPDQQLECLKALIPRTRNRTLHISTDGPVHLDLEWCLDIVDYVTAYCERWETLTLRAVPDYFDDLFRAILGRLPCLKMLKLDLLRGDEAGPILFEQIPNLESVHITGDFTGRLELDTRALVHLHDETAILLFNLQPTHGYSHLTTMKIIEGDDWFEHNYDSGFDKVLFPALKSLDYTAVHDLPLECGFLKYAKTPVLEELFMFSHAGCIKRCLARLKRRSGTFPLKSLLLDTDMARDNDWNEDSFPDVLGLYPNLECLVVNLPTISNISRLAISEGTDTLVPNLRKCTIAVSSYSPSEYVEPSAIVEMVEARCNQPLTYNLHTPVYMQFCFMEGRGSCGRSYQGPAGIGHGAYPRSSLYPVHFESWYKPGEDDIDPEDPNVRRWCRFFPVVQAHQESLRYAKVVSGTTDLISQVYQFTDNAKPSAFECLLHLAAILENVYKSESLVGLLAKNMSIALLYLASELKNHVSQKTNREDEMRSHYCRVVRILKRVKSDLLEELDRFHWIWELHHDFRVIHYIHDHHEIREDPDRFANAILGLADDLWIFEDL